MYVIIVVWISMLVQVLTVSATNYAKFVDPLIGSDYHGNVFVGASVPFGMVQLGPTNLSKGWLWCSGYHYSDSTIIGFSHTHLNGTGIGDLGDILFMPSTGIPVVYKGDFSDLTKGYVSVFSRKNEIVQPGFYSVLLNKYDVRVNLTTTERVGYHQYIYPQSTQSNIVIDLKEGIGWDEPTETYLRQIDAKTVEGYRYSTGWAKNQKIYFRAVFSKDMAFSSIREKYYNTRLKDSVWVDKGVLSFSTRKNEKVELKVGISYVSCANAAENIAKELSGWDFNKTRKQATKKWNNELSKINIKVKSDSVRKMFYSSLYRTMISPSLFADVNGQYRGADGEVYSAKKFTPYTIFSTWDTYRAFHPLQMIINRERSANWANSLLDIAEKQGSLPIWHLVGNETGTMVGVHSIPIIADAVLKNCEGVDSNRAYTWLRTFEQRNDRGLNYVRETGWIPADKENWSVSKALEYAIDDHCIAQVAAKLGKAEDYQLFAKRAEYYKNYFDPQIGFMRGKLSNGSWRDSYNPSFSMHEVADYVEGNGWQYTWLVPHDVKGLITLFGGKEKFARKLDSLFTVSSRLNEGASIDISGMIGQYAHGNEPGHSTLYLYQYVGQSQKTAELVRRVMHEMYKPIPAGLCGNDDCGQMSAWYIFSALGFYPVDPVSGKYIFGSPVVDKAVIRLNNGRKFTIRVQNNSNKNIYVKSVSLNGKQIQDNDLDYNDILNGGEMQFNMSNSY